MPEKNLSFDESKDLSIFPHHIFYMYGIARNSLWQIDRFSFCEEGVGEFTIAILVNLKFLAG